MLNNDKYRGPWIVLSFALLYGSTSVAQTCEGGGATSSCAAKAEPATQPSGAGEVGVGNPINVMTGNKYQREVDMPALPGVLGLEIVRHYNSALSGPQTRPGALGRGWRLSYESSLRLTPTGVQVDQADGSVLLFGQDLANKNSLLPRDPSQGSIEIIKTARGDEYLWTWTDGRKLRFNVLGQLEQIQAPTGEVLSMQYDKRGFLLRVTDPQGRSLRLGWLDKETAKLGDRFRGVQTIDSPLGRFSYGYGSEAPKGTTVAPAMLLANLVKVTYPVAGEGRRYHYESALHPTYMTGISIDGLDTKGKPASIRYATFGYRSDGRANLSTHANDVDKVTVEYTSADTTTVTNSLGQKTTYRFRSFYSEDRLLEVRGAGCSLCGEPNVRYGYDSLGRLTSTTKLAADGTPLRATLTELDNYGRARKVSQVAYVAGRAQAPQWQQRYEYAPGSAPLPILIARPSVAPGQEYVTKITYERLRDAVYVPVRISERGFAPTLDGKGYSYAMERTVAYRYNAYGQRIETDGPLANAPQPSPANSDITVSDYDRKTKLVTKTVAPGGIVTQVLERDDALRPSKMSTSDGATVQTTAIRYNLRGQPEQIDVEAMLVRSGTPDATTRQMRTLRYRYDLLGNLASVTLPGNLTTSFVYDAAGRLTQRINPDGSRVATVQDSEGHLVSEGRYLDADMTPAKALQVVHYRYDDANRLKQVDDAAGVRGRMDYTPMGQVAQFTNALGGSVRFDYDANGLLVARTQSAKDVEAATVALGYDNRGQATKITDANGVATERRYDDFGRKIAEVNPDRGMTLYQYDAAGRLVARADESQTVARYRYDHTGRLIAAGADKQADLMQYRYQGMRRSEIVTTTDGKRDNATEIVGYEYDAFGQVTQETRWMARVDAPAASTTQVGLRFVTRNTYDEAGRLTRQQLPDGHAMRWRYRDSGQLEAILFDDAVVVSGIEQTQVGGLTGYVNGNGIRQKISLDGRGRIHELQALGRSAPLTWWQRVLAWFGAPVDTGAATIYRQTNGYDAADRLTDINRQKADPANPGRALAARAEHYGYDGLDRLTQMPNAGGTMTTLRYDRGGNRISEARTGAAAAALDYRYAPGTNRVVAMTQAGAAPMAVPTLADATRQAGRAWFYHDTGVPLAQVAFAPQGASLGNKRVVYNAARRPIAVYNGRDELLARYHYNGVGERVAKTVYAANATSGVVKVALRVTPTQMGVTTYSLYRNQRLAMEADANGQIRAHYVYLGGRPVAKVETTSTGSFARVAWTRMSGGASTQARIYAIHTDHLGSPQVVSDEQQRVVWQADTEAFGRAHVRYAAAVDGARSFEMNLRLPGQVYDRETELHYNYLRDYDPDLGRYTTPDPLGIDGGINPYAYVGGNPLTNIDPLGLYQSDVHYYLTFFMAMAAGIDYEEARTIALATQYVDNNPDTRPLDDHNVFTTMYSITWNQSHLAKYHFVLWEKTSDGTKFSSDTDVTHNSSTQLNNLENASTKAPNRCAKLVLFGEYLHTFEDTFAHRDKANVPYGVNNGFGHGLTAGSNPDYTYNDIYTGTDEIVIARLWMVREERTLKMAEATYNKLKSFSGSPNAQSWENVKKVVEKFIVEREHEGDGKDFQKKLEILTKALEQYKVKSENGTERAINLEAGGKDQYDANIGKENREKYLCDANGNRFKEEDYPGTILPTSQCPK